MTDPRAAAGLDQAGRRHARWMLFAPYAILAGSLALVPAAGKHVQHQPYPVVLAVVAAAAAWAYWWTNRHPAWQDDPRRMGIFFVGLMVLIYLLLWCSPLFGVYAWSGYLYAGYALRGRWRLAGGAAVAVGGAISQIGGFTVLPDRDSWGAFGLLLLFNVGISGMMNYVTMMADKQSAQRAQMIDELAEANAKLAAALRENAGLHAQLLAQAREAGVLDERQRMAGEIHDVLAQGLTGIVTQLEAADAAAARPADWRRHLDTAKQLARESLSEARRSVQALRPQNLDSAALPEAIGEVADGWSERNGVAVELITTGPARPLLPEIETTLLRTAQEALANVARHANAGRVALTLSYMEDVVTLDVRDDGAGFDPAVPPVASDHGGYGLAAMRERLLRIAGTLDIESEPGGGTALSACVPAITVGAAA